MIKINYIKVVQTYNNGKTKSFINRRLGILFLIIIIYLFRIHNSAVLLDTTPVNQLYIILTGIIVRCF